MSFLGTSIQGTGQSPICHGSQADAAVANGATTTVKGIANTRGCRSAKFVYASDQVTDIAFYGWDSEFSSTTGVCELVDMARTSVASTGGAWKSFVIDCAGWAYISPVMTNRSGGAAASLSWRIQFFD